MMATFARLIFPEPVIAMACESLDFDPSAKGQFYKGEKAFDWFEQAKAQKAEKK